mgnify:CR=1 FL=1
MPDGSRIEDRGINFRQITRAILSRYVGPRMETVAETHHTVRRELSILIEREAAALFEARAVTPAAKRPRKFAPLAFLARSRANEAVRDAGANREMRIAAEWEAKAHASTDPLQASAYRALARVLSAVLVRHGRVWGSREMIATLATDIQSNHCPSTPTRQLLEPWLLDAAKTEG